MQDGLNLEQVFGLLEAASTRLADPEGLSEGERERLAEAVGGCLVALALLDAGERVQ